MTEWGILCCLCVKHALQYDIQMHTGVGCLEKKEVHHFYFSTETERLNSAALCRCVSCLCSFTLTNRNKSLASISHIIPSTVLISFISVLSLHIFRATVWCVLLQLWPRIDRSSAPVSDSEISVYHLCSLCRLYISASQGTVTNQITML